ncbi:DUF4190 domain-containing protein [Streptomyces sp. NPDC000410]|uniref:DUF4190 domain-containing protein n=1 Tax=Streptomyces sp. NPDC000410 TaxID=3154254 RepID=UPI003333DB3A
MSQYTQHPQQPPYAEPARPARNGLGTAALILGIIGAVAGIFIILFWLSGVLGVIGLILGLVGLGRIKRGEATNKGVAITGVILSVVSLILAVVGAVVTFKAVDDAVDEFKKDVSSSSSSKPGSDKPLEKAKDGESVAGKALAGGDSAEYPDKLMVTVSEAKPYTPGEFAIGHTKGNKAYKVTVVIENGGTEKFEAALLSGDARAGKDGVEAEKIYDDKVGEPLTGTILPGKKVTVEWAFDAPADAKNLTLEVNPGFEYDATIWDLKL